MNTQTNLKNEGREFTDEGEFYDGLPVVESSGRWCIAQRPSGSYVRHYDGMVDQIFTSIHRALDDCGCLPD